MRTLILYTTAAALLAGAVSIDADARPRRAKKSVEHITFPSGYIEEKVAPYVGTYDRVIVSNELVTKVTEGKPICRLTWVGRRVDALLGHEGPLDMLVAIPRGASIEEVSVYLVDANGKDGREVEEPDLTVTGDSLVVTVADPGDAQVVDLQYQFEGEGISVDESFVFQPEIPVLKAEYRFSVSRELWQEAADHGLAWEFSATAEPRTWKPASDDSPEFYSWYWRDYSVEPLPAESDATPRAITVTGYLPAPVLAAFDPENLPDVNNLDDILDFTESLVDEFGETSIDGDFGGGSGSLRDRYAGSEPSSVPSGVTKGGSR